MDTNDGEIDQLSRESELESEYQQLVDAWIAYHQLLEEAGDLKAESSVADAFLWAIDELDNLVGSNPEKCWLLILEIFSRSTSDYQRASLAAGLLENLLVQHGTQFIDRIEKIASSDKNFRDLLSGVWRRTIDAGVWERLRSISV